MYLADNEKFAAVLRANQQLQAACGAATRIMDPEEIGQAYPFYALDDIVAGSHNPVNEGYFDGGTMFDWWRRSARERGAEYLANEVIAMDLDRPGRCVESVTLRTGERIACGAVVNASGPRAVLTARMAGIELPVEPRKRYSFVFDAARPLEGDLPLTIDPSGVHMRTDGRYYLAGCPPDDDPAADYDDFEADPDIWEQKVWPALARRIPQFDALRLVNSWVGHYAYNTLDQNAIVGPHSMVENFLFVNGFSGHGLQQSPALGRGLAEWITWGEYRSLDLSPFGYGRIERGEAFAEKAVI
jgi:glycine/D-amino acid oxidase-like deaminating enzyme